MKYRLNVSTASKASIKDGKSGVLTAAFVGLLVPARVLFSILIQKIDVIKKALPGVWPVLVKWPGVEAYQTFVLVY